MNLKRVQHELRITVEDFGLLSFGQTIYCICDAGNKSFYEKCSICDGTKTVTIRGREFPCPNCNSYGHPQNATYLSVHDYQPVEFIINEITICGPETKGAYLRNGSLKSGEKIRAKYAGFTRYNSSTMSVQKKQFNEAFAFDARPPEQVLNPADSAFLNKADCLAYIKRLHEIQKEKLEEFNLDHGTEYEYPFDY